MSDTDKDKEDAGLFGIIRQVAQAIAGDSTLPENVRPFVEWLRQKNKGTVEVENVAAERNPANQPVTLVRLKETGFLAQNYLFAFAELASESLTQWLMTTASAGLNYGGIALLAEAWPPERYGLEKELSVLVRRDRVRLGKDSAAPDYLWDWLAEQGKAPRFEKKELIEERLARQLYDLPATSGARYIERNEQLTNLVQIAQTPNSSGVNPDSLTSARIISVWGQTGVGKSYLLKELQRRVGPRAIYGWVDHEDIVQAELDEESENGLARLLAQLAFNFADSGCPTSEFNEVYKRYVNLQRPPVSTALAGTLVDDVKNVVNELDRKGLIGQAAKLANDFAFIKDVAKMLNVGSLAVEAGLTIYDRISQAEQAKNEAVLKSRPIQELTAALVRDLSKFSEEQRKKYYLWQRPVLIFDSYEQIGPLADKWLRTSLLKNSAFLALRPLILIAGRYDLTQFSTRWAENQAEIYSIQLEPFDQTQTAEYLKKFGISDPERAGHLYEVTGGLPLLLHLVMLSGSEEEAARQLKKRIEEADNE